MKENWKDIPGYEGFYRVSDLGNVESYDRLVVTNNQHGEVKYVIHGRRIQPCIQKDGYHRLCLYKDKRRKYMNVHQLVMLAFVGEPNGFHINHIDENKSNNSLGNLEYCTTSENINHGTRNDKVSKKLSKAVKSINVNTGETKIYKSLTEAALSFGGKSKVGNISSACNGKAKTAYGYCWNFI